MTIRTHRMLAVLAASSALAALTIAPASASASASGGGGGGGNSGGPCSAVSTWTLQGQVAGTQIAIRADVYSNEPFSTWTWKLFDNGTRFAKGTSVMDRERHDLAFFEVRRSAADQTGTDAIRFTATQTATGEVCDGSLTI